MTPSTDAGAAGLADRLAALGLWTFETALRILPRTSGRSAGRALGWVAYHVFRVRRTAVESQLAASFPAASPEWVRATARQCYRHFGEEFATLGGGAKHIDPALDGVVDADGAAALLKGEDDRAGAIIVLGHMGNWELAGAVLKRLGFPPTAVAQEQAGATRRLNAMRARLGIEILDRRTSPRVLLRRLSEGNLLALVADQHAPSGSVRLDFLGRPAWTTLGPARLSIAAGVPLFFCALVREGDGHRFHLRALGAPTAAVGEVPEVALTRAWVRALETEIRARPEQYFWFHRRWKRTGAAKEASGTLDYTQT